MKLSDTQSLILSKASRHEHGLAAAPQGLPAAARDAVFRAMLKHGLLAECPAPREHAGVAWREDADCGRIALSITEAGLRAIGAEPDEGAAPGTAAAPDPAPTTAPEAAPAAAEPAQDAPAAADDAAGVENPALRDGGVLDAPAAPSGRGLRRAAQAVLAAWDGGTDRGALAGPVEGLRGALARTTRVAREPGAPRKPRHGTKREAVLALLRRPEGASGPQIAEATGWAAHTVRGFLAGLQSQGVTVTVLERARQVGPNRAGAKGSYTVYQVEEGDDGAVAPGAGG